MAKVSSQSPRYRTKDEIVIDLTYVLNSPLTFGTKWAVLSDAMWVWTEYHGKYKGCRYWSKLALMQHKLDPRAKLLHEHAVPKRVVMEMLARLQPATVESVRERCERLLIGVVVTPEEDDVLSVEFRKTMPAAFFDPAHPSYLDPWLRYTGHSIDVFDCHGVEVTNAGPLLLPEVWKEVPR